MVLLLISEKYCNFFLQEAEPVMPVQHHQQQHQPQQPQYEEDAVFEDANPTDTSGTTNITAIAIYDYQAGQLSCLYIWAIWLSWNIL